jgi:nicotinate-nucleotide adenylyltransferase
VIGSDNLARFHEWHNFAEMLTEFKFFVYPRLGFALESLHHGMEMITGVQPVDISSTQVRRSVQEGESISHLVKPAVAQYIQAQHLYVL